MALQTNYLSSIILLSPLASQGRRLRMALQPELSGFMAENSYASTIYSIVNKGGGEDPAAWCTIKISTKKEKDYELAKCMQVCPELDLFSADPPVVRYPVSTPMELVTITLCAHEAQGGPPKLVCYG
jgi:hypothetical protein